MPCLDDLASWSRNLSGWQRLLSRSHEDMDEALTITKVARLVGDAGSVDGLRGRLASGAGLSWLVSLLELARDAGETGLLDGHNLLPTQSGGLRRRPDVRRDEGISEELKDIAEAFGLEIRDELLDKGAELEGLAELLASEREPELLDRVLARVKDECREGVIRAPLALWAVRLFRWMADRPDYVARLEGYPVPTSERSDEGVAVLLLERGREALARPLAPLATWPEGAQRFGSLFPRRRVLAENFADGDPEVWPRLAASGYVNASPLIETQRVVEAFLPDEPLPELDGAGSHKSTQELEISDVAFLVEPDIGTNRHGAQEQEARHGTRPVPSRVRGRGGRARLRGMQGRVRMWGQPQDLPGRMARAAPPPAVGAARRQRPPRHDGIGGVVGGAPRGLAGNLGGPVRGPGREAPGRPGDQPRGPRAPGRRRRRGRAAGADRVDAGPRRGGRRRRPRSRTGDRDPRAPGDHRLDRRAEDPPEQNPAEPRDRELGRAAPAAGAGRPRD